MTDTTFDHTAQHNADPAEIAKFEALASRWWDPQSEFKPLHEINPLRLDYIDQRCGGLAGKTVVARARLAGQRLDAARELLLLAEA